jgi:hypothetical protein
MLGETKCNALALKAEVVEPTPVGSHSYYSVGQSINLNVRACPCTRTSKRTFHRYKKDFYLIRNFDLTRVSQGFKEEST